MLKIFADLIRLDLILCNYASNRQYYRKQLCRIDGDTFQVRYQKQENQENKSAPVIAFSYFLTMFSGICSRKMSVYLSSKVVTPPHYLWRYRTEQRQIYLSLRFSRIEFIAGGNSKIEKKDPAKKASHFDS